MRRLATVVLAAFVFCAYFYGTVFAWHENIPLGSWVEIAGHKTEAQKVVLELKALLRFIYYKNVDEDECSSKILQSDGGIVGCLDNNSRVIKKEYVQQRQEERRGNFGGAGIEIKMEENNIVAAGVREDGPAYKAGIRSGDILVEVDGKMLKGSTLVEAVKLIRGKVGTEVLIKVSRGGEEKIFKFLREKIKIEFLKASFLYSDLGYMRLKSFEGDETLKEFGLALESFEKSMNGKKDKSVIVDVRDNPGGFLEMVKSMLALFAKNENDVLVTSVYRNNLKDPQSAGDSADDPKLVGRFKDFRVVVLVNGYSASASEIFAAKMKESGFLVVGEKTYGKGTVQADFNLSDGSWMHLTIAEYFVGDGFIKVDGIGVEPGFAVSGAQDFRSSAEILREDRQLGKAIEILRNQ